MNHFGRRRYRYVSSIAVLVLFLTQSSGALAAAITQDPQVGMSEVTVQVDGLSCPFCAYGLEKKLKKVENVADLSIQVDSGQAVLRPAAGTSLDLEEVEKAVRDGGFTPRGITLTARGRLTEFNGLPALELPNDTVLLLSDDAKTSALLDSGRGAVVRVEGQATLEAKDGHTGHPYTLAISTFEID